MKRLDDYRRRSTWFFLMTYSSPEEFQTLLDKSTHFAYAYHDKDDNEPHYHVLVHFESARTGYACIKDIKSSSNTFLEEASNPVACYEYLTHKNDLDKYQYTDDIIISHNPVYWKNYLPSVRDRPKADLEADFLEDLISPDVLDLVYMAKKYGRDFIKNYRSYLDFRNEVAPRTRRY